MEVSKVRLREGKVAHSLLPLSLLKFSGGRPVWSVVWQAGRSVCSVWALTAGACKTFSGLGDLFVGSTM